MIKRSALLTLALVSLFSVGALLAGCPDKDAGKGGAAASASAAVSAAPSAGAKTGSSGSGW